MNQTCVIVVLVILLITLGILLYKYCTDTQISGFANIDSNNASNKSDKQLAYANDSDPYNAPFILNNFISADHCKIIMDAAVNKLFDSEVVGGKVKEVRNSQQCWIKKSDPLVKNMFEAISNIFNIPVENAEDLQVVRYLPGQYYNEHHDSCCDDNDGCSRFVERGGQRKLTVLIYLNSEFGEGHTYFKNLGLKIKPAPGDAIVFYPLAANSDKCHPLALHSGTNVTSGEKWIANLWYREDKF